MLKILKVNFTCLCFCVGSLCRTGDPFIMDQRGAEHGLVLQLLGDCLNTGLKNRQIMIIFNNNNSNVKRRTNEVHILYVLQYVEDLAFGVNLHVQQPLFECRGQRLWRNDSLSQTNKQLNQSIGNILISHS